MDLKNFRAVRILYQLNMIEVAFIIVIIWVMIFNPFLGHAGTNRIDNPISIISDKWQYAPGETIQLTVTNNHKCSIWYIDYPQPDLVFWKIEKAGDDGWQPLDFRLPLKENGKEICVLNLYERPVGVLKKLKPGSVLNAEWNQSMCSFRSSQLPHGPEKLSRGRYRFSFKYSFDTVTIREADKKTWLRPVELGETQVSHSVEIVIE